MDKKKTKYALFDMDGLMFDTEELFMKAFEIAVSEKTGIEFKREDLNRFLGLNRQATDKLFPELYGTRYTSKECYDICYVWMDNYMEKYGVPIKPGLLELLEWLKEHGYKMAIASGTATARAERYCRRSHILQYFDAVIGGDKITKSKPDPQIFRLAAEALGCTNPEECIVFEDSLNGLLSGSAAGMAVFIVPDKMDPTIEFPDLAYARLNTLDEAIEYLE